jgi:hypothetical protein
MLLLRAALALVSAHLLPGLLLVGLLRLGRNRLERIVLAATLGGPLAAVLYLVPLALELPALYWVLLLLLDGAALWVIARRPARPARQAIPRSAVFALFFLLLVLEASYLVTTGGLFRLDPSGNLLLDSALQRDTLFHVGLVRALVSSYPPELLSVAGVEANYHVGYHLQLAGWSRFFGIDAFDGIYRLGAGWSLALLVGSAFLLGLRFHREPRLAAISTALLFGSGLGYLFYTAPGAGWWSLVFLDAALVSVFLVNPLLPALPLFFVGLATLEDHLSHGERGSLVAAGGALASLLTVKVFLGVQVLAALGGAAVLARGERAGRLRRAVLVLGLAATPFLGLLLVPARGGNTAVSWRPLEIVRYSMEKLGWEGSVRALAAVGSSRGEAEHLALALGLTALWLVGFLGLRLAGLPALTRDAMSRSASLRQVSALFVLAGFVPALFLRIAPAEATGLSRLEAINDVLWFSTQSGILMWFWTSEAVGRAGRRLGRGLALGLASLIVFPATAQHFVYKLSHAPDVVPAAAVEAAAAARFLSAPGEVFLEPPDRVRPSLLAYLAGRPVVYDSYVDYDYMFVSRAETDFRRHAVAQFWKSSDAGYASWFLKKYRVTWIYATETFPLPAPVRNRVERRFQNDEASLYRVSAERLPADAPFAAVGRVPMGLAGAHFFGAGWGPPQGSPRARGLAPGEATLFLPLSGAEARLTLEVAPGAEGELELVAAGRTASVGRESSAVELVIPGGSFGRGLHRVELRWAGSGPLLVRGLRVE